MDCAKRSSGNMFQRVCRLCLGVNNLISLFGETVSDNMKEIIHVTSGVEISKTDRVTQMVCTTCCQVTIKMYQFRIKSIKTDEDLKSHYAEYIIGQLSNEAANVKNTPQQTNTLLGATTVQDTSLPEQYKGAHHSIKDVLKKQPNILRAHVMILADEVDEYYQKRNFTVAQIEIMKEAAKKGKDENLEPTTNTAASTTAHVMLADEVEEYYPKKKTVTDAQINIKEEAAKKTSAKRRKEPSPDENFEPTISTAASTSGTNNKKAKLSKISKHNGLKMSSKIATEKNFKKVLHKSSRDNARTYPRAKRRRTPSNILNSNHITKADDNKEEIVNHKEDENTLGSLIQSNEKCATKTKPSATAVDETVDIVSPFQGCNNNDNGAIAANQIANLTHEMSINNGLTIPGAECPVFEETLVVVHQDDNEETDHPPDDDNDYVSDSHLIVFDLDSQSSTSTSSSTGSSNQKASFTAALGLTSRTSENSVDDQLDMSLVSLAKKSHTLYTCRVCDSQHTTLKKLRKHEKKTHTKCSLCNEKFQTLSDREEHVANACLKNRNPVQLKDLKLELKRVDEDEEIRKKYWRAFKRVVGEESGLEKELSQTSSKETEVLDEDVIIDVENYNTPKKKRRRRDLICVEQRTINAIEALEQLLTYSEVIPDESEDVICISDDEVEPTALRKKRRKTTKAVTTTSPIPTSATPTVTSNAPIVLNTACALGNSELSDKEVATVTKELPPAHPNINHLPVKKSATNASSVEAVTSVPLPSMNGSGVEAASSLEQPSGVCSVAAATSIRRPSKKACGVEASSSAEQPPLSVSGMVAAASIQRPPMTAGGVETSSLVAQPPLSASSVEAATSFPLASMDCSGVEAASTVDQPSLSTSGVTAPSSIQRPSMTAVVAEASSSVEQPPSSVGSLEAATSFLRPSMNCSGVGVATLVDQPSPLSVCNAAASTSIQRPSKEACGEEASSSVDQPPLGVGGLEAATSIPRPSMNDNCVEAASSVEQPSLSTGSAVTTTFIKRPSMNVGEEAPRLVELPSLTVCSVTAATAIQRPSMNGGGVKASNSIEQPSLSVGSLGVAASIRRPSTNGGGEEAASSLELLSLVACDVAAMTSIPRPSKKAGGVEASNSVEQPPLSMSGTGAVTLIPRPSMNDSCVLATSSVEQPALSSSSVGAATLILPPSMNAGGVEASSSVEQPPLGVGSVEAATSIQIPSTTAGDVETASSVEQPPLGVASVAAATSGQRPSMNAGGVKAASVVEQPPLSVGCMGVATSVQRLLTNAHGEEAGSSVELPSLSVAAATSIQQPSRKADGVIVPLWKRRNLYLSPLPYLRMPPSSQYQFLPPSSQYQLPPPLLYRSVIRTNPQSLVQDYRCGKELMTSISNMRIAPHVQPLFSVTSDGSMEAATSVGRLSLGADSSGAVTSIQRSVWSGGSVAAISSVEQPLCSAGGVEAASSVDRPLWSARYMRTDMSLTEQRSLTDMTQSEQTMTLAADQPINLVKEGRVANLRSGVIRVKNLKELL